MRSNKPKKIFFSVFTNTRQHSENADNHMTLLASLKVTHFDCVGVYKGQREDSICVVSYNQSEFQANIEYVKSIAKHFNQESILLVDSDDSAKLVYVLDDYTETLDGSFQEVSASEALKLDAYTYEPIKKVYYTVK